MAISRTTGRWREFTHFVRHQFTWGRLYRTTSYLKSALWTVPLIAIALEMLLSPLIRAFDDWQRWYLTGLSPAGATALYQTVITMTLSFLVFIRLAAGGDPGRRRPADAPIIATTRCATTSCATASASSCHAGVCCRGIQPAGRSGDSGVTS
jgi:hypothetical protein